MKKLAFLLYLTTQFIITGCGGGNETIRVSLQCDSDCNEGNAVVVKIYQLKNVDKFSHASFESLVRNPDEILGDDLISGAKFEKLLTPDESFPISEYVINKDAVYIGIVGDFHTPAKDGWSQVIPVEDIDDLVIKVHANSLSVEKE